MAAPSRTPVSPQAQAQSQAQEEAETEAEQGDGYALRATKLSPSYYCHFQPDLTTTHAVGTCLPSCTPASRPAHPLSTASHDVGDTEHEHTGHDSNTNSTAEPVASTAPILESYDLPSLHPYLDRPEDRAPWHAALVLSEDAVRKDSAWCLDIVQATDAATACFTKSYSRFAKGTGSVIMERNTSSSSSSSSISTGTSGSSSTTLGPDLGDRGAVSSTGSTGAALRSDPAMRRFDGEWRERLGLVSPLVSQVQVQAQTQVPVPPPASASVSAPASAPALASASAPAPAPANCLRYFSPEELLRLFGFNPPHTPGYYAPGSVPTQAAREEERARDGFFFGSQDLVGRRKRYELLGNSVSVTVLREVLSFLLLSTYPPPHPRAASPTKE